MFCSNCGNKLIDDAVFCGECGNRVSAVVKNDNSVHTNNNNIDNTNYKDKINYEKFYQANLLLEMGKYNDSFKLLKELSYMLPENYEVWWGMLRAVTQDFNIWSRSFDSLYKKTLKFASESERVDLDKQIEEYKNKGFYWEAPKNGEIYDLIEYRIRSVVRNDAIIQMKSSVNNFYFEGLVNPFFKNGEMKNNEDFLRLCNYMDNIDYKKIREEDKLWGCNSDFGVLKRENVLKVFFERLSNLPVQITLDSVHSILEESSELTKLFTVTEYSVSHYFEDVMDDIIQKSKRMCYITTAVCQSLNKGDDCEELGAFREFRDNWLKQQVDGETLIQRYYITAPKILNKIMQEKDADVIFKNIWQEYLSNCYQLLLDKNYNDCKELYIKMVEKYEMDYEVL